MKIRLKQKRLHGMSCRVLNAENERVNGVALNVKMYIVLNVSLKFIELGIVLFILMFH